MSTEPTLYAVDRLEGDVAVLVDESGDTVEVDRTLLPDGAGEGSVLRVWPMEDADGSSGSPDWGSAELADDEEEARLEKAREMLEELRNRDPGGDIVL